MRRSFHIILWTTATAALLLWLAQFATPSATIQEAQTAASQPPAAYPSDFEQKLTELAEIKISLHPAAELPGNIPWQSNKPSPPVGSPAARKGGTLRLCNVGPFPANFLAFGSLSPQFFHYNLFERINVPLVWEHPATGQEMSGLAEAWGRKGDCFFFRLQPTARYSNGRPVRAADFALGALLRIKNGDTSIPTFIKTLRIYGDKVLAVEIRHINLSPELSISKLLHPAEPGFYADFTQDYPRTYAQRIPPTTGAYSVTEIQRNRLIALKRVPQWWADELPGFRYTHNFARIEHHFLTDEAQAWEMLRSGRLDIMQTRNIAAWHSKLEGVPAAEDGRIVLHSLTVQQPMPPYGIALNAQAIPNEEIRRGILQALDMGKAIDILFRGYAAQLTQFTTGYRHAPHQISAYHYSPAAARSCFANAGYTESGPDGILRKPDGTRLSFHFTYTPSDKLSTLASILVQSAAACGLEIVPHPQPWQNISRALKEGSHELVFWASMPGAPLPDYRRFLHSASTGSDAPFRLNSPEMDAAITAAEQATTPEQAAAACKRIDELIYHLAIWLPGWMENRANVAAWKHIQLPPEYAGTYDVAESHQLWSSP